MRRLAQRFVVASVVLCGASSSLALSNGGEDMPAVGSPGGPSRALSRAEAVRWMAGRGSFTREHREPDGLGAPGFNAASCAFCHKEPTLGGAGGPEVDVITLRGTSHYDTGQVTGLVAGNQLERMQVVRRMMEAEIGRGRASFLARRLEIRQTPSLLGLGLIDTIPDEEILRNEDPDDTDGDGVRGIARRIQVGKWTEVGRFGWKGDTPRLADFVCRALGGELGLTAPDQRRGFGLHEDCDAVVDPEASQECLDDLAFFVANLAAPRSQAVGDPGQVERGALFFERIGCAACHVPVLHGSEGPVRLYSDLLLHAIKEPVEEDSQGQMRFGLVQAMGNTRVVELQKEEQRAPAPAVPENAFRTAPLWGIARTAPYLHDGMAKTMADAVLAHDVEAASARDAYRALSDENQKALLAFLESL